MSLIESLESRNLYAADLTFSYALNHVKLPYTVGAQTGGTVTFKATLAGNSQHLQAVPDVVLVASKDKKYDKNDVEVARSLMLINGYDGKDSDTQTTELNTASLPVGNYYLIAVIDPSGVYHNSYYESNTSNNSIVSKRPVLDRVSDVGENSYGLNGTKKADKAAAYVDQDQTIFKINKTLYAQSTADSGAVQINLGQGDDVFKADASVKTSLGVSGSAGRDTIYGGSGNDHIDGGKGNDRLYGGLGADFIAGGLGTDRVYDQGTKGVDSLFGGDGDDYVQGDSRDEIDGFEFKI